MSAKETSPDAGQAQAVFLFEVLRLEAPAISRATRVPLEDVEQQMMLMCLEVAQTVSDYDPRRGGPRVWLIKRAWLWARRWSRASARGEEADPDLELAAGRACAGTDELMIDEETRRAEEQFLARVRQSRSGVADPRTGFEILAVKHWSEREAVKWCGGSRKMARHAKRRAAALAAVAEPVRTVIPVQQPRAADISAANAWHDVWQARHSAVRHFGCSNRNRRFRSLPRRSVIGARNTMTGRTRWAFGSGSRTTCMCFRSSSAWHCGRRPAVSDDGLLTGCVTSSGGAPQCVSTLNRDSRSTTAPPRDWRASRWR